MDPAFSSTKQAGAFALLLLVLLILPLILEPRILPSRVESYSSAGWIDGAYPYLDQQIFIEKGPLDIVFIGPSHMWAAIDTPAVQEALSQKLGRPAVVRTLGWTNAGYDALYFATQDLLQHRQVHLLVYYDAYQIKDNPHELASLWFRFGDNAQVLTDLPLRLKISYYFASLVGLPHNLLGLLRTRLPADLNSPKKTYWEERVDAERIVSRLGSVASKKGFTPDNNTTSAPFEVFKPEPTGRSSKAVIYSKTTREQFKFTATDNDSWQYVFARKFVSLAQEHHTRLALLHIPTWDEGRKTVIEERQNWPEFLKGDIAMIGITPEKFGEGISDADFIKLFGNSDHLNKNGQEYFTSIIIPRLLELYDAAPTH